MRLSSTQEEAARAHARRAGEEIMYLRPFYSLFPKQGVAETRSVSTDGWEDLPDDDYAFIESYCFDPECDCRRVMLNVRAKSRPGTILAAISFGFDRDSELAGPFLDPINPQSRHARAILSLAEKLLLSDPDYVARLEAHHQQVKKAVGGGARTYRGSKVTLVGPRAPRRMRRRAARDWRPW